MKNFTKSLLLLLFLMPLFDVTAQKIIYFDVSNKNTVQDGKSWKTAYSSFNKLSTTFLNVINTEQTLLEMQFAIGNYDLLKINYHFSSGVKMVGGYIQQQDGSFKLDNGVTMGRTIIRGGGLNTNYMSFHTNSTQSKNDTTIIKNITFQSLTLSQFSADGNKVTIVQNCDINQGIFFSSASKSFQLKDCLFSLNRPDINASLFTANIKSDFVTIENCKMNNNIISYTNPGTYPFLVEGKKALISNLTFIDCQSAMSISSDSVLIENFKFSNSPIYSSVGLVFSKKVNPSNPNSTIIDYPNYVKIINSSFNLCEQSISGGADIFLLENSQFNNSKIYHGFVNSTIINNKFEGNKSKIILLGGKSIIKNNTFNENEVSIGIVSSDKLSHFKIDNCVFDANGKNISSDFTQTLGSVNIENCIFKNSKQESISCNGFGDIKIKDCEIYNSGSNGISIQNSSFTSKIEILNTIVKTQKGYGLNISSVGNLNIDNIKVSESLLSGLRLFNGSVVKINNSIFQNNGSLNPTNIYEYSGIELHIGSTSNTEIKNCIIQNNKNTSGIFIQGQNTTGILGEVIIQNTFVNNNKMGIIGMLDSKISVNKCIVSNNQGGILGGGIIMNCRKFQILSSTISNNISNFINFNRIIGGGGIIVNPLEDSENIISNCLIFNNSTDEAGGGIKLTANNIKKYIFHIYNTVFHNNTSKQQGGAIFCTGNSPNSTGSNIVMTNCTIYDNITFDLEQGGGGGFSSNLQGTSHIRNSIFWNNKLNKSTTFSGADIFNKNGQLKINNSLLQLDSTKYIGSNSFVKLGNIFAKNPRYLDSTSNAGKDNLFNTNDDGFRLTTESPCLNIGENNYNATVYSLDYDIAGNPRIQDKIIDLGAYEGGVKVVHTVPQPSIKTIAEGSTSTITLPTLTDYGNPVTYTFVSGPATLKDNVITPTGKPGKITVTGKAAGTEKDATISICVNPSKPAITLKDVEGDFFLKSSTTSGNVWYNNDKKTPLTSQEITALYDSFYTLQIDVEGCLSTFSDKIVIPKDKVHTIGIITLTDLKEGNEKTIDIPAKTDFGNTVNYTITGPATILNGKLTVGNKPGLVQIVGKANKTTKDVIYKFCVIPNKPTISLINNNGVYKIKSSLPDGNIWFKNDTKITFTTQEISADYEATYKLQIDLSGCISEVSDKMIIPKLVILGVDDSFENEILLYPNPTNNELIVKSLSRSSPLMIKIMDMTGRVILSEKYNSSENNIKLNLTNFASGTYLIELETNKTKTIKKIIKQ